MKGFSVLVLISAPFSFVLAQAPADIPKRPDFNRYAGMLARSPFAVATAVVAPAATPNFAKDLYLSSAAKSPDGDMVTVSSSADRNFKKYLTTKEPVDGYAIVSIEWSERVGETKATISKDGQYAVLSFNQALLSQAPTAGQGNIMPGVAPTPVPGNIPRPNAVPNLPTPVPHVRGVIPRNPSPAPPAQQYITPPPVEE